MSLRKIISNRKDWKQCVELIGYVGDRDCADVLVDALSKLEYRGYDSAGIAVL